MKKKYVFLVQTRAVPGKENEYNEWYNKQHLPDVLRLPGFVSAHRFRYAPMEGTADASHPYVALYMVETDNLAATQAALTAAVGTPAMVMSDAIDLPNTKATYFEAIYEATA